MNLFFVSIFAAMALGALFGLRWSLMAGVVTTLAAGTYFAEPKWALIILAALVPALLITWPPLIQYVLGKFLGQMPALKISETEKIALNAGHGQGFEYDLMRGEINWDRWMKKTAALRADEAEFLETAVEELAQAADDWELSRSKTISPKIWDIIKKHKFFGLVIPKEYGGLGFSAYAHHRIIAKLSTRSATLASMIGVPNSLGPAELILHYGTDEQKNTLLPRLAKADEIPCFALTNPWAGSDAGAITDRGLVARQDPQDPHSPLGVWISCDKRYITLAPIATIIGIAFRLEDPDHLLSPEQKGAGHDLGVTLALVPRSTPGLEIGKRHSPMDTALINGPVRGRFFVPLSAIIGGREGVGRGWAMLMECLSIGRSVTLPSASTGSSVLAAVTTGAYVQVRHQFGNPLINFEGVQDQWLELIWRTYCIRAIAGAVAMSVDEGERPMVGSAIAKYQTTSMAKTCVDIAMDLHAGRAVQAGPNNYLALVYQGAPISITVEGANLLTQSVMVYAPALIKTHPYLVALMEALDLPENKKIERVSEILPKHISYAMGRAWRSHRLSWTAPKQLKEVHDIPQAIERYASVLAWVSEWILVAYGAQLKKRETQMARLADALSDLWMAAALVRQHAFDKWPAGDEGLIRYAAGQLLNDAHVKLNETISAFPSWARPIIKMGARLSPQAPYAWTDKERHILAREATHGPRYRLADLGVWPENSAAGKMHRASKDYPFLNAISKHDLTPEVLARWRELIDVDEFDQL